MVEKNVQLNVFHLKINIAINVMMIMVICMQLYFVAWLPYKSPDQKLNGNIHLLGFYNRGGIFDYDSNLKISLASSAFYFDSW